VVRKTAEQVIKDFQLFSIEIHFSGHAENAYIELRDQLIPELQKLYDQNYSKLQSLFYRIDVSEKKVRALNENNKRDFISGLTDLILERELVKVITRKLYSER
jgi:hypothetical protein